MKGTLELQGDLENRLLPLDKIKNIFSDFA